MNMRHPHVLQLIMDSLRYWVTEMHVDGFRFDLAATLARELHEVDRLSAFFDLIQQDPVVSQVKLIAEPWDVGEGGYQVGNFPPLWSEWNGKFRDTVRDYWLQQHIPALRDFGYRFTGSSDLYEASSRRPSASVNFVTAHDGFTLADLVSYDHKHNEANLEDGRDGTDDNRSWNHGVEGPTDDPEILAVRRRQRKNLLITLLCSQGVPMLLGGDELGRTQRGNNNAYCQDGELSWFDWSDVDDELLDFTRRLVGLRREHPVFRRRRWFQGRADPRLRRVRHRLAQARRHVDDPRRLELGPGRRHRHLPERPGHAVGRPAGAADRGGELPAAAQPDRHRPSTGPCPARRSGRGGRSSCSSDAGAGRPAASCTTSSACAARSATVLRRLA